MPEWFETYYQGWWFAKDHVPEEHARFIRKALRLRKGQRVLDAPCGDGQVSIRLARRGIHVTGVDFMKPFIARARRRFRKEGLPDDFHVLDLREIDFEGEFHAVCNWFNSFGYFSDADNIDVLHRLVRALRPGGRLLIDQTSREFILRHPQWRNKWMDVTTLTKWRPKTQRMETRHVVGKGGKGKSSQVSVRLYTPGQFRDMFERARLKVVAMYGDWEGSRHHRGSRRIVIVGRRP